MLIARGLVASSSLPHALGAGAGTIDSSRRGPGFAPTASLPTVAQTPWRHACATLCGSAWQPDLSPAVTRRKQAALLDPAQRRSPFTFPSRMGWRIHRRRLCQQEHLYGSYRRKIIRRAGRPHGASERTWPGPGHLPLVNLSPPPPVRRNAFGTGASVTTEGPHFYINNRRTTTWWSTSQRPRPSP